MKKIFCLLAMAGLVCMPTHAAPGKEVTLKLLETSDVHGCYFPYDFIKRKPMRGSLAHFHKRLFPNRLHYRCM